MKLQLEKLLFKSLLKKFQKLVLVLVISMLMTEARKEDDIVLKKVLCIYYLI